ncbi:hypothetical protein SAMN05444320_10458 [Streptoalloteichus hindustanus]|uniref:Uncharacterized protein n=1 Tax=Streptoalloteichus hindustanus TaxID=2017 RepID=A0A1M5CKP9_STRHI|nr:hypothetical protein SAMN05444320_10458 [Streptoalloteichus hindustanus]
MKANDRRARPARRRTGDQDRAVAEAQDLHPTGTPPVEQRTFAQSRKPGGRLSARLPTPRRPQSSTRSQLSVVLIEESVAELPPRARGRQDSMTRIVPLRGTIPACAGPTARSRADAASRGNHPRVRGADRSLACRRRLAREPSPRARGRPLARVPTPPRAGTIPACAGTTSWLTQQPGCPGNHPRVRGDDSAGVHPGVSGWELPPRARGRPEGEGAAPGAQRTIPACAGPTPALRGSTTTGWNHPRVRGADVADQAGRAHRHEPSPRARGRPIEDYFTIEDSGTIPACAGPTSRRLGGNSDQRNHPRVRGADAPRSSVNRPDREPSPRARGRRPKRPGAQDDEEPSPRARGRPGLDVRPEEGGGTIPACAGPTPGRPRDRRPLENHPRVRGADTRTRMRAAI